MRLPASQTSTELRGRDLIDVLAYPDIAAYMGVDPETLQRYKRGGRMPPPDDIIGATPLWHSTTIKEWLVSRRRTRSKENT